MAPRSSIFADGFSTDPYWWNAWRPESETPTEDLPRKVDVLVVGAGYAGVSCAATLAAAGINVLALDAGALGHGASSRSGGQITGGVNIGKAPGGRKAFEAPGARERREAMLVEAADAMTGLETLIERHGIACGYHRTGRLTVFWSPDHYGQWEAKLDGLNRLTAADARMVPPERMGEEIASRYYFGGAVIGRAGHLHPAELYGGLLAAARRAGARLQGGTPVVSITRRTGGFTVQTARGEIATAEVVLATNGYPSAATGALRRKVIPVTSHMIATEELPEDLARSLIPRNRAVSETRRVTNHFRMSPDGRRLLFGGRARFVPTAERRTAALLHRAMVRRFPQLQGIRLSHSWEGNVAMTFDFLPHVGRTNGLHFALGCNGSGVVMMTHLGGEVARAIIGGQGWRRSAYDTGEMASNPLYHGTPWFLSGIGTLYQMMDAVDHWRASRKAA